MKRTGIKHGLRYSPEYGVWRSMKNRCYLTTHKAYKHYGGRGITVCDRWRESFEAFYDDMGPRPSPEHQLNRIDNDGNYEPDNCEWATSAEHAHNKRARMHTCPNCGHRF